MQIYDDYHQRIISFLKDKIEIKKLPEITRIKLMSIVEELDKPIIQIDSIRTIAYGGIPDQVNQLRLILWQLLISYLPLKTNQWQKTSKQYFQMYKHYIDEFMSQSKYPDYPYEMKKQQQIWLKIKDKYFLWEQIQKDTARTHAQLNFFSSKCQNEIILFFTGPRKQKFKMMFGDNKQQYANLLKNKDKQKQTYVYDHLTRVLFIYANLNPRIKYVQGMNQLVAPLYFLLESNKLLRPEHRQSQALFMLIMLHIKDFDKSHIGIKGKMDQIQMMMEVVHEDIYLQFQRLKITPYYYSFRWITLMFAQQFQIFDVLRLWDAILSQENRMSYLNFLCMAILQLKKQLLLAGDFTDILQCLQNLENVHLGKLINQATSLRVKYQNVDIGEEIQVKRRNRQKFNFKKWIGDTFNI